MPKQIWKINQFHGGLNSNSDPRDIADNELSEATDVMVDELGKIRTMGGTTVHDAGSKTVTISPGYGLFAFSADRTGIIPTGVATVDTISSYYTDHDAGTYYNVTLTGEGGSTNAKATVVVTASGGTAVGTVDTTNENSLGWVQQPGTYPSVSLTGGSGSGCLATVVSLDGIVSITVTSGGSGYVVDDTLTIDGGAIGASGTATCDVATLSDTTAGIDSITLTSAGSGYVVDEVLTINKDDIGGAGTGNETCAVETLASSGEAAQTGDNYLVLADNSTGDVGIYIYSEENDVWTDSQLIDIGTTNDFAPCFYYVDGVLRVSDGNFNNTNQWYGYIDREYFGGDADEAYGAWKSENQLPAAPTDGYVRKHNGASLWDGSADKPEDSLGSTGDGFLRMSMSGSGTSTITTWIPLQTWDHTLETELSGPWYTKYGGWDYNYSEDIDSNMEGDHTGDEYFGSSWNSGAVVIDATAENCVPSAPSGHISTINKCMNLIKVESEKFCRYKVETGNNINLIDKSIFFDLYISSHMASVIDYITVYAGEFIIDWNTTSSSNQWIRWKIDGSSLTDTIGDWQRVEIFTGDTPYQTQGSAYLGSIDSFAISINTLDKTDKFGYTTGEAKEGDCLIYRLRYGEPTEARGWNGKYNFYYSYLYDDIKQESSLIEFNDHSTSSPADYYQFTGTPLYLKFYAQQASSKGWNHASSGNPRITGANVYYAEVDDSGDKLTPSRYYLCTVDFEKGTRIDDSYGWAAWAGGSVGSIGEWYTPDTNLIKIDLPPTVRTFATKSGYDVTKKVDNLYYKTAVVANRMVYIGNVKYDDEDGKTHTKGDAILKSHINKFDLFTIGRIVEASIQDGDSIVKLEEYADRILQFKKHKMHLINVSQEIEFLEDTFIHKGVAHPAATCKTDFGIAWVNKHGCYLYDGKEVRNLLEKKGRQIIKEGEWKNFITDNAMIGYFPQKRQLIVIDSSSNSINRCEVIDGWSNSYGDVISAVSSSPSPQEGTCSIRYEKNSTDIGYGVLRRWVNFALQDGDSFEFYYYVSQDTVDKMTNLKIRLGSAWNNNYYWDLSPANMVANTWTKVSLLKGSGTIAGSPPDWDNITYIDFVMYTYDPTDTFTAGDSWHFDDMKISANSYIYDLVTQSWVKGDSKFIANDKTNFITDWNGDLAVAHTSGTIVKWDDSGDASSNFSLITKDIDFGQPAQRKKIYKIYVTYKTSSDVNASGVLVKYDTDGGTSFAGGFSYIGSGATFLDGTNEYTSAGGLLGGDDWHTIALTPTSSINNIYSFQLKFHSPNYGHADFEINDISIVYRLKPVR